MGKTLVALFDNPDVARRAVGDLLADGFDRSQVLLLGSGVDRLAEGGPGAVGTTAQSLAGMGVPLDRGQKYAEALLRGAVLVVVRCHEDQVSRVSTRLNGRGAEQVDRWLGSRERPELRRQASEPPPGQASEPPPVQTSPVREVEVHEPRVVPLPVEEPPVALQEPSDPFYADDFEPPPLGPDEPFFQPPPGRPKVLRVPPLQDAASSSGEAGAERAGATREEEPAGFRRLEPQFRRHYGRALAVPGEDYETWRSAYRIGWALSQDPRWHDKPWSRVEHEARVWWANHHEMSLWVEASRAAHFAFEKGREHTGDQPRT